MLGYVVVVETDEAESSFSAYSPNLPGCVAVGETRPECEALMREAIGFHIEGLIEHGDPVPPPVNVAEVMVIEPPAV